MNGYKSFQAFYKKDKNIPGVAFPIKNSKDGTPTLRGSRFKVFALLLLASDLKLNRESTQIDVVLNDGVQHYHSLMEMYRNDSLDSYTAHELIVYGSLYNRQILATTLLRTQGRPLNVNVRDKVEWSKKKLTTYDAQATPYDLVSRSGVLPPDFSNGHIEVEFVAPLDDKSFLELVQ